MVESTSHWYLIGLHGDMVLRVRQGMPLGETEAGELSFDPSCAQLELGIADDGGLMLSAVDDHELEFGGGTRCRQERLARDRSPEIRLPHNVLRVVTDFVNLAQANETVKIRAVRPADDVAEPQIARWPQVPLLEPADVMTPAPPRADVELVGNGSTNLRTERRGARHRRIRSPSMAALIVLSGLVFALLYAVLPGLRNDAAPEPSATVARPAPSIAPAQAPSTVAKSKANSDARPSIVSLPPKPEPTLPPKQQLPAVNAPLATEPARRDKVAERPPARLAAPAASVAEPEPMAAAPSKPVVQARVKRPSIPRVAESADSDTVVAIGSEREAIALAEPEERQATTETPTLDTPPTVFAADPVLAQSEPTTPAAGIDTAVTIGSQLEPTVVADPQESSAATQTPTVELARTLFAADQALAQGRLTTPADENAYTLYNRVLAADPESAQARSGLQSVRQGLINRALAQLASGALEDARTSLQAAADVGADPSLVAHLRDEVNYRQRLVNARGEQYE